MPVPDYQSLMLPLLEALADGKEHALRDVREVVAKRLDLTEADREEILPSGKQSVFDNRLGWAKTYLDKAGVVQSVRRGVYQLTERGRMLLMNKPKRVDNTLLAKFPEFSSFVHGGGDDDGKVDEVEKPAPSTATPQEALEAAFQQLRQGLEAELLSTVKSASFRFFERLVVELLVKMGYGGNLKEAGKAIGRTGDDGLDGVIREDHLGLDAIYIQAKRWKDKTVGRPDVQAFAGSLMGVRGRKGVFITTSKFSDDAHDYVSRIDNKIVLIDGPKLASLMVDFGIGVNTVSTYEVKRVDADYFSEE